MISDPKPIVKDILASLEQFSNPVWAQKGQKNYPTAMTSLGITMPQLRSLVKEFTFSLKGESAEFLLQIAHSLLETHILDAQLFAYNLLASRKSWWGELSESDLIALGQHLDNWVSVDTWAGYLAGPAWRNGQVPDETIMSWTSAEDRWWRRSALVCTTAFNKKTLKGPGDPIRTLAICTVLVDDKDDMIVKAMSWALRMLGSLQPDPVWEFLDTYEERLAPRIRREVIKKLTTGLKNLRK